MPARSKKTRDRIEEIIRDHHLAFMVEVLGPKSIPPAELKRLVKAGVVTLPTKTRTNKEMVTIPAALTLGKIAQQSGDDTAASMSDEQFWAYVRQAPPKLSPTEQAAIASVKDKVGNLILGLGVKYVSELDRITHEVDDDLRRQELMTVRREVATGILEHKSAQQIATALQRKIGPLQRDWLQIAHTEVHNAIEEGKATSIMNQAPETDPLVFKRPRPDACRYCKILFLDGRRPRVFRMSELSANGPNQGRRAMRPTLKGEHATEWMPVLGAVHPWCQCSLHHLPDGFDFDPSGDLVFTGQNTVEETLNRALLEHECF